MSLGRQRIVLSDATTGREIRSFDADDATGSHLAFTPDSKRLVTNGGSTGVHLHDVARGVEVSHVQPKDAGADVLSLSADGSVLAATSTDRPSSIVVCDSKTGKQLASFEPMHDYRVHLALSHDGKQLATYGLTNDEDRDRREKINRTIQLWDVARGKEKKTIVMESAVGAVAFSPDDKTMAITSRGDVQIRDLGTGKRLRRWDVPLSVRDHLTFAPDGKRLVLMSFPSPKRFGETKPELAVWDLEDGERLTTARLPECELRAIGCRGKSVIGLGLHGRALVVWDVLSGTRFDNDVGHRSEIGSITFREGRIYTTPAPYLHYEYRVQEWDPRGKPLRTLTVPDGLPVAFSPDGSFLLSSLDGISGSVRSIPSLKEKARFEGDGNGSWDGGSWPEFSADGRLLASTYRAGAKKVGVRVVRMDSGKELARFSLDGITVSGLAFDPSGKRLAVAVNALRANETYGTYVVIWRLDANRKDEAFEKYELPRYRRDALCPMAFSPEGRLLAVGRHGDGAVHLLNGSTGEWLRTFSTGSSPRVAIGWALPRMVPAFSPDGRSLATALGERDPAVGLWEVRTGKKRWEARLSAATTALAFDPSGQLLVSGHADGTALVWDVTGRFLTHKRSDAKGWDALVNDLSSADATKAFAAQRILAAGANLSVAQMANRVKPAGGKDPSEKDLNALIEQLDDDEQDVRRKAFAALEKHGKEAEAALRRALAGKPSAEVRRSVAALLDRIRKAEASTEALSAARAVEVLEWIGTAEAKSLLAHYSGGRPGATLTLEAKAALARLSK